MVEGAHGDAMLTEEPAYGRVADLSLPADGDDLLLTEPVLAHRIRQLEWADS
jgi:hypothetical protein